jgi:hypothetical protein
MRQSKSNVISRKIMIIKVVKDSNYAFISFYPNYIHINFILIFILKRKYYRIVVKLFKLFKGTIFDSCPNFATKKKEF